jgi:hypothetical protein
MVGMTGSRVDVKVESKMCGSEGKPGSVKTGRDWPPSAAREMSSVEIELDESLPINWGKPSDAVKAVRLSCFLS